MAVRVGVATAGRPFYDDDDEEVRGRTSKLNPWPNLRVVKEVQGFCWGVGEHVTT